MLRWTIPGLLLLGACQLPCLGGWWRYDLPTDACPDGAPRLRLQLTSEPLALGEEAEIDLLTTALFVRRDEGQEEAPIPAASAELRLLDPQGEDHPLDCAWSSPAPGISRCTTTLPPTLTDGDSTLVGRVQTAVGEAETRAKVPFYARAFVHVLVDSPLHAPGDTLRFRALVLGRQAEGPLGPRPGLWEVRDPSGHIFFAERGQTTPWGIASSDLPLADDAPHGTWRVRWITGEDQGQAEVEVKPHSLPRAEIAAKPTRRWFKVGDPVVIEGKVRALSGLPVRGRPVRLELAGDGDWPPPLDWLEEQEILTDAQGAFRFTLSAVPEDLRDLRVLSAGLSTTTGAGERVSAAIPLILSRDDLAVEALTEGGEGLVPDLPNRVFLRVGTPDGAPLPGVEVFVKNAWDPRDTGRSAQADEDGVASFLLDPGQPVALMDPPPPLRAQPPPPREAPIALDEIRPLTPVSDLASLALADAVEAASAACGWRVIQREERTLGISARAGRIDWISPREDGMARCLAEALRGRRLEEGIYQVDLQLQPDQALPRLEAGRTEASPAPRALGTLLDEAAIEARSCVLSREEGGEAPFHLAWSLARGERQLRVRRIDHPGEAAWPEAPCLLQAYARLALPEEEEGAELDHPDTQGVVGFELQVPAQAEPPAAASPRTHSAFEHLVSVAGVGETTWQARPGSAPPLRIRPSSVLLEPGEAFTATLLRGPGYRGELPDRIDVAIGGELWLCPRTPAVRPDKLDPRCPEPDEEPSFSLRAPEEGGFLTLSAGNASAVVYVKPTGGHHLGLAVDSTRQRPGGSATLQLSTDRAAVVSLVGVDATLGQIATLPATSDLAAATLGRVQSQAALGGFDALALVTGGIQGENAMRATLQRLRLTGPSEAKRSAFQARGETAPDLEAERLAAFSTLLLRVRAAAAATSGVLDHEAFARLWEAEAAEVSDPFGRPMTLDRLPTDLLALAEPRLVVLDAARLPEDLEPWIPWVQRRSR